MIPITAIAQAAKAAGPAVMKSANTIGATYSRANVENRKLIKEDVRRLKKDDFGYSNAQKNSALADSLAAIRAQSIAQSTELSRQAAASGDQAGRYFAAQKQIAQGAENQAGAVGGQIQANSDQVAAQQRANAVAAVRNQAQANLARAERKNAQIDRNKAKSGSSGGGLTSAYSIVSGSGIDTESGE